MKPFIDKAFEGLNTCDCHTVPFKNGGCAVEWLKMQFTGYSQDNWEWQEIQCIIDEAFKDVMNK